VCQVFVVVCCKTFLQLIKIKYLAKIDDQAYEVSAQRSSSAACKAYTMYCTAQKVNESKTVKIFRENLKTSREYIVSYKETENLYYTKKPVAKLVLQS